MLTFPRDPYFEFFVDEQWHNVAADVRQLSNVSITHGRKDYGQKPSPCRASFTLDDGPLHGNGRYHPDNAMSDWHGLFGFNTPVRMGFHVGDDTFTRANGADWGTGPLGPWTSFGAGSTITANRGRHSVNGTNTFRLTYLPAVVAKQVEVSVDVTLNVAAVTGGNVEPGNIVLRGVSTGQYYMLRVAVMSTGFISVAVHTTGAALSGTVVLPFTYSGQTLRVKFQADDTTFRGKVWPAADDEPFPWSIEYSHGDVWDAGWVGIRTGVALGNTNALPVTADYDNLQVRLPRFAGEVAKMVPTSEEDHTNQRTSIEAAGILRRLQQGTTVLDTAIQRLLTRTPPFTVGAYWPLDEDATAADVGKSLTNNPPAVFARVGTGAIKWGEDARRLSIDRGVNLSYGGLIDLRTDPRQFGNDVSLTWTHRLPADALAGMYIWLDNNAFFHLALKQGGAVDVTYYNTSGSPTALFALVPLTYSGDDNAWTNMGFSWFREGVTTRFLLSFEGTEGVIYTYVIPSVIDGKPVRVSVVAADSEPNFQITIAHLALYPLTLFDLSPVLLERIQAGMNGYAGETAAARLVRLLAEEGVPSALNGYANLSPAMGGQPRRTLLEQIFECVDVDQGILSEPTGAPGIRLRTLRSMIDQAPALTLDYSAGHVAKPFGPTSDDQNVVNDVEAKRPLGGTYRLERATGPLNTGDPGTDPQAVGRYDQSVTVNVETDDGLADVAGWRLHVGTVDEPRVPTLTVNLGAREIIDDGLTVPVLDVGVGDVVTVTNAAAARLYDDLRLLVQGYTETWDDAFRHRIVFNTVPASPYDGGELDAADTRLDSDTSTLAADFHPGTDLTMMVTTAGDTRWTNVPGEFPFTVRVGGAVVTVTAIVGTGATQTFNVSTVVVNGVTRTARAGSTVRLAAPVYLIP